MYKIYYDDNFYDNMSWFSNYLKDYFYKLYTDTGIIDEYIILDSYDNSINLLQDNIFGGIEKYCKKWLLWRHLSLDINDKEEWYFFIKINSYKIKVSFELYKLSKQVNILWIKN